MERGKFQPEIDRYLVDILLQNEDLVALRQIDIGGFRGAILRGVASAVEAATGLPCLPDPLEVARRLVRFTLDLPPWTRKTLGLVSVDGRSTAGAATSRRSPQSALR